MKYFHFIKISCDKSNVEMLTDLIWEEHPLGVEENIDEERVCLTAFFVDKEDLNKVKEIIQKAQVYAIEQEGEVEQKDWIEQWMREMKPKRINKNIVVVYDLKYDKRKFKDKIVIIIIPSLAFGTGFHESTILCMREIDKSGLKGKKVLDVGTGSGILSILAIKKGAEKAIAVDIDEDAIKETIRNSFYNKTHIKIIPIVGTVDCINDNSFDFIFSNLYKSAILEHMDSIVSKLKEGGKWILSGITCDEKDEIDEKLREYGGKRKWRKMNEWLCCSFIK
jgi:ribosomal protein L11 methyltransferase